MKKIFLIIFVLLTFRAQAHQDLIYSTKMGNIHLQYVLGWGQLETGNKINIFLKLCDKLIREKFPHSVPLNMYFGHDYTKGDTTYYAAGYGQFSPIGWRDMNYKTSKKKITNGLKLLVRDRDFDIKKMLQLVNAAYSNIDFIKNNQSEYSIKSRYYDTDTVTSIPFSNVATYLSSADPVIDKLLNEKQYRNEEKVMEEYDIDYYFQNNKFHFYNTGKQEEEWLQGKQVVTKSSDEAILTTDNVSEIFGTPHDGHFVFIDDSTFYFIPASENPVRGPFKIDSIRPGRRPVLKYYYEHTPASRFILFINDYRNQQKALFIPDSNFLVSNYNQMEDELINGLFKKTNDKKIRSKPANITIILFTLLGCCLMTIIWLIWRQRK